MDDIFAGLPPAKGEKRKDPGEPSSSPQKKRHAAAAGDDETPTGAASASSNASSSSAASAASSSSSSSSAAAASSSAAEAASPRHFRVALAQAHFGSKGRRQTMEDAHLALSGDETRALYPSLPAGMRVAMYGVFDGHGGRHVADFVKETLPSLIMAEILKFDTLPTPSSNTIAAGVERAWAAMDAQSQSKCKASGWTDGCCAVMLLVVNDLALVANMGDSKAVLCRRRRPDPKKPPKSAPLSNDDVGGDGSSGAQTKHKFPWNNALNRAMSEPPPAADGMPLTQDHKPILATERQRIEKAGGQVTNGRVNGMIEVSRSFGDMPFKKFGVAALCDVRVRFKLTDAEEFVLLGCDGLWSRYSESNACAFLRGRLWAGTTWQKGQEYTWDLPKAARALVEDAVHAKGCQDNTSAMVIQFEHPGQQRRPVVRVTGGG